MPLSIALSQRNIEKGPEFLMGVSDPASPDYGKHWPAQTVADTFAPSQADIEVVYT